MTTQYTPMIPQIVPSTPMIPSQPSSGMHIAMQMPTPGSYPDGGQTLVMEPDGDILNPDLPNVENPSVVMVLNNPDKLPEQLPAILVQPQPEVPAPVPEQPVQTLTEFKPTPPPVTEPNFVVPLSTTEAPVVVKIEIPTTEKVVVPEEPKEPSSTVVPKFEAAEAEDAHVVVNTIAPTVISAVENVNQELSVTVPPTVVAPVESVKQEPAVTVPPTVVAPVENVAAEDSVTSLPESREEQTTVVMESRSDDITEKTVVEAREEDHTTLEPESRADDTTEQSTGEPESRADDATEKMPESRADDTTEKVVESRTDDTTEKVDPESRADDTTEKVEPENRTDDATEKIVLEERSQTVEALTEEIQTIAPSTKEISDNELD